MSNITNQYGIKETKEAITLLAALAAAGDQSMSDGKIDLSDMGNLMALVPVAPAGFEGIQNVKDEVMDLTVEERQELEGHIDAKFGAGTYSEAGEEIMQAAVSIARVMTLFSKKEEVAAEGAESDPLNPTPES